MTPEQITRLCNRLVHKLDKLLPKLPDTLEEEIRRDMFRSKITHELKQFQLEEEGR